MSKSMSVSGFPRRIIESILARLGGRVDVNGVRRILGIRPEELREELETYSVEELRGKEGVA